MLAGRGQGTWYTAQHSVLLAHPQLTWLVRCSNLGELYSLSPSVFTSKN